MLDLKTYRTAARRLIEYAVNGTTGRGEQDPVYQRVCEGKDPGAGHAGNISSCGFLPSWLWFRLGVRTSWLNRDENARYGYRNSLNISLLCDEMVAKKAQGAPNAARQTPSPESRFSVGDVLVIWNSPVWTPTDAGPHTFVVLEHMDHVLLSGDYGQPGGKLVTRQITQRKVTELGVTRQALFAGSKQIRRWLPLDLVLQVARQREELVEPDLSMLEQGPPPRPLPTITDWPRLEKGDSDPPGKQGAVHHAQHRLNVHGAAPMLKEDGGFGEKTLAAVKDFQRRKGLKADGVIGSLQTWPALEREP